MFEVDEPAAEEYDETEIGAEGTEIPAPFLEVVEDSELAPIDYATERQVISEPVEEILEEIPAETEFEEEAVEVDELAPIEEPEEVVEEASEEEVLEVDELSPLEEPTEETEDSDEVILLQEESEDITIEEEPTENTDEVILLEEEPAVENEIAEEETVEPETEEYEAIVLVPAEENPPVVASVIEENPIETTEEETVIPVETNVVVNVEPEPVATVIEEQPVVANVVEPAATSYEKYIVPSLRELESGKYYIQIATMKNDEYIMEIVNKYGNNYPITIVPKSSGNAKQVMIGPITIDEYGALLERFKSYGFKDAFLRKIR